MEYEKYIREAKSIVDLFYIAKELVVGSIGYEREGIQINLMDIGYNQRGFTGAFYKYTDNTISLNMGPIANLVNLKPELVNYYVFHLLLHEYIHAIGVVDELQTRRIAFAISKHYFGEEHILTRLAYDMKSFFPYLLNSLEEEREDDFDSLIDYFMRNILWN